MGEGTYKGAMQRSQALGAEDTLLLTLAEQLMRPFKQLSNLAELAGGQSPDTAHVYWQTVQELSQASMQLVECYALHLRLQGSLTELRLEPLAISSLLYDTAQDLQPLARQYNVEIEVESAPNMLPVIGDYNVLRSALLALGQVFVLAQAQSDDKGSIRLAGHKSRYGLVAGLYTGMPHFGPDHLRRAQRLSGIAREPLHTLTSGPAAGVFVADALLQSLKTRLHAARYHGLTGLAVTLDSSEQMQLV